MSKRNQIIDLLKLILAFVVIFAHVFPSTDTKSDLGLFYYHINGIARITLPVFFIFSGYFLKNHIDNKPYLIKYAKRIFLLFIVWQIIYFPILIKLYKTGVVGYDRLILDAFYGCGHLWYLIATFEAVFLLYFLRNLSLNSKFYLALILFLLGYISQIIFETNSYQNEVFKSVYVLMGTSRNFLFYAFPYIMLGSLYEDWKAIIPKIKILTIPLFIVLVFESYLYIKIPIPTFNIYFTVLPLSMILVYFAIESKKVIPINIKSNLSLGIYLCHFYFVYYFFGKITQNTLEYLILKYVLVCLCTLITYYILDKINKKIPIFF